MFEVRRNFRLKLGLPEKNNEKRKREKKLKRYQFNFCCHFKPLTISEKCSILDGRRSGVFIVDFEHVSHLFLVFLLLFLLSLNN